MCSHRALTPSAFRWLVIAAAAFSVVIVPAPAPAAETGLVSDWTEPSDDPSAPLALPAPAPEPEPEPSTEPDAPDQGDEGVTSSTMRLSPNLTVVQAKIHRGRLTISAIVASGATGKIRGRAHFGRGTRRFTARIDSRGVIRIDKRLRGARHASSARVHLAFRGTRRFLGQSLTLRVARQSAQLRVLRASR